MPGYPEANSAASLTFLNTARRSTLAAPDAHEPDPDPDPVKDWSRAPPRNQNRGRRTLDDATGEHDVVYTDLHDEALAAAVLPAWAEWTTLTLPPAIAGGMTIWATYETPARTEPVGQPSPGAPAAAAPPCTPTTPAATSPCRAGYLCPPGRRQPGQMSSPRQRE